MWLARREYALSWDLPLSFCKYKWIGISLAIALTPNVGAVLKALTIHKTAHL